MKPVVVVDILTESIGLSVKTEYINYSLVVGQELYCTHCTCIVHYIIEDPPIRGSLIKLVP